MAITEKDVYGQFLDGDIHHATFLVTHYDKKEVSWRIKIKRTDVNYGRIAGWIFYYLIQRGIPAISITTKEI